jgi:glutamate decarboxylase
VQRILVRQGVSRDLAEILVGDMAESIAHFDRHPTTVPMTKEESGGFSHM